MAASNVPPQLVEEIKRWAASTMTICRSYGAPASEEDRFYQSLMLFTHPDRFAWCTRMHDLVACLRTELQRAHSGPRPAVHIVTPIVLPPSQPWPPFHSPATAQLNRIQAFGTSAIPPTSSSHFAPKHKGPPPNCITPRATAKPKAPPLDCTTVPKNYTTPSPATFVAQSTPTIHPPMGDWWQDQDDKHKAEELRVAEDIRLAVAASLLNTVTEHTTIQEIDMDTSPPGPPDSPAPATSYEPAPPPYEPYDEDEHHTDANGVTTHKDGWQYKVTVRCKNCNAQYKTRWVVDHDPYKELLAAGWEKGRDGSGNYSWQKAHCPNFRRGCSYTMHT